MSNKDGAAKKSIWIIRRVAVLIEATNIGEILAIHISATDMCADAFTKYVKLDLWRRFMHYVCNLKGVAPKVD